MQFKEFLKERTQLNEKIKLVDENDVKRLNKDQLLSRWIEASSQVVLKQTNHPDFDECCLNYYVYNKELKERGFKEPYFDYEEDLHRFRKKGILKE